MRSAPLCAEGQERVSMEEGKGKQIGCRRENGEVHVFVRQPTVDLVRAALLVLSAYLH